MKKIPKHLKKFIVKQNYSNYSYIDQACWQFIMKISIDFFSKNADNIYSQGLDKTGISIDKIPKIDVINKKLSKIGWNAVCVRGFIPPNVFMEFQSLRILPIAADMRNHKHLTYTPSPDIVHEAAGHAPIIANNDYANYLINYGEIASKAIMSSEDMNLYYAIRNLSDIKENINATDKEILQCDNELKKAYKNISYVSEAAMLSRMNWWTVEYGLIGNINNPKIYGAGLLSSVAESENCLTDKVKKIPFTLDCLNYKYDITEQQPQLFVAKNYNDLTKNLKKLSKKLSYTIGGEHGLNTAIKAKTVCTIELDNELQISGIVSSYLSDNSNITFIKLDGPVQLCLNQKQLKSHGPNYHSNGYSSPIGNIKQFNKAISELNEIEQKKLNLIENKIVTLRFDNNINLTGRIINILKNKKYIKLISFNACNIKYNSKFLYKAEWGNFDLVCGSKISSVYAGPADTLKYYIDLKTNDNKYSSYNTYNKITSNKVLNNLFKKLSILTQKNASIESYETIYTSMKEKSISDWLLKYKLLEAVSYNKDIDWIKEIYDDLYFLSCKNSDISRAIKRGLLLIN